METLIEEILTYSIVGILALGVLYIYLRKRNRESHQVTKKIEHAKEFGFHEPMSLHPVIDLNLCIGSGACVSACPEQDILGWRHGRGEIIHAAHCVGHGACFHACPVEAISLVMGTEKRGVELPHVNEKYESNVPGIYIAGELGGMGLIKNAVEQGKQAVENISKTIDRSNDSELDLIIIGAGPAGIGAALTATKNNLRFKILDQDTLGGTVASFPRAKIVMTSPMELPLHGKVKFFETSKTELIELWNEVLTKNSIAINENVKVESIEKKYSGLIVHSNKGELNAKNVLLAIGRRGSPRKLGVPGERSPKVYYRLLEPELIQKQNVLVVGGGDSAIEAALLIAEGANKVTLSYRGENFNRIKPDNFKRINSAIDSDNLQVLYSSQVDNITDTQAIIKLKDGSSLELKNDLVYVMIGGELPTDFLMKSGISISKKFGEVVLKH
ncbi:MAG: NAD(P)-binding domain-containing protein [Bacteroidetes bacterium]|nr:NAD(P)-binding domain-containing protein [Bacteroidota bacterium]